MRAGPSEFSWIQRIILFLLGSTDFQDAVTMDTDETVPERYWLDIKKRHSNTGKLLSLVFVVKNLLV